MKKIYLLALLVFACNSKDYLQKAKRGELVPSGEALVRSNNEQVGVAIVKGANED